MSSSAGRSGPFGARRVRLTLLGAAALGLSVLVGAVTGSATPAGEPPRLFVEVPETALVGKPLDVFVSVDVPATVRVRYAETEVEEVTRDLRVSFLAEAGTLPVEVEAEDVGGRIGRFQAFVTALWPVEVRLEAPASVTVGDPLAVILSWRREHDRGALVRVEEAYVELAGERLEAVRRGDELIALTSLALQAEAGTQTLRGVVVDEFGEAHERFAELSVGVNPNPVQELNVAAGTLALVTPEGRELEAVTLATAFAAVGPEPRWEHPFVLPVAGRHTSAFGLPRRYAPGGRVSYHLGTDLAAPTGTPIVATNDGVVRVAGMYPIKGGLVIIDHGFGVTSLYFHQSALAVEVGEVVERGQVIGYVGSTGLSTGPHLHWEMRVDGVPTAPLAWLDRRWPGGPLEEGTP